MCYLPLHHPLAFAMAAAFEPQSLPACFPYRKALVLPGPLPQRQRICPRASSSFHFAFSFGGADMAGFLLTVLSFFCFKALFAFVSSLFLMSFSNRRFAASSGLIFAIFFGGTFGSSGLSSSRGGPSKAATPPASAASARFGSSGRAVGGTSGTGAAPVAPPTPPQPPSKRNACFQGCPTKRARNPRAG